MTTKEIEDSYFGVVSLACDFTFMRTYKSSGRKLMRNGSVHFRTPPTALQFSWIESGGDKRGGIEWEPGRLLKRGSETIEPPTQQNLEHALATETALCCIGPIYLICLLLQRLDFVNFGQFSETTHRDNTHTLHFARDDFRTELQVSEEGFIQSIKDYFDIPSGTVEQVTDFTTREITARNQIRS